MPSMGSTTQVISERPSVPPSSSPRKPSWGRASCSRVRIRSCARWSITVTTSVAVLLVLDDPEVGGSLVDDEAAGLQGHLDRERLEHLEGGVVGSAARTAMVSPARRAPAGARAGWDSTRAHTRKASVPRPGHAGIGGSSPRAWAARSSTRSTSPDTNSGSMPTVGTRTSRSPSRSAVAAASVSRS